MHLSTRDKEISSMSLATSFYNHHGIIMCADKLVNANIFTDPPYELHQSHTEQKLFLIENKYGLSYTGTASIKNVPTSAIIEEYLLSNKIENNHPKNWLYQIANNFKSKLSETQNIIFILCGYIKGQQFVMSASTQEPNVEFASSSSGILYSGESKFIDHLICSKLIAFDYEKFTMQDSINFLRFLNNTVAGLMYFGQVLPTVSKDCDILAIYPNETYWVTHDSLH